MKFKKMSFSLSLTVFVCVIWQSQAGTEYRHWQYPQKYVADWYDDMNEIWRFIALNCTLLNEFYRDYYNISITNKCDESQYPFYKGINHLAQWSNNKLIHMLNIL